MEAEGAHASECACFLNVVKAWVSWFLRNTWSQPAAMSDESDVDLRFVSVLTLDGPLTNDA